MKTYYTPAMRRWLGGYEPTIAADMVAGKLDKKVSPEAAEKQREGGRKGKLRTVKPAAGL